MAGCLLSKRPQENEKHNEAYFVFRMLYLFTRMENTTHEIQDYGFESAGDALPGIHRTSGVFGVTAAFEPAFSKARAAAFFS